MNYFSQDTYTILSEIFCCQLVHYYNERILNVCNFICGDTKMKLIIHIVDTTYFIHEIVEIT